MKMIKQRLMGVAMVVIAGAVVALASTGTTPEDQDATAAVMIGPLGLYMIFTRDYILYDGEPVEREPRPRIRERHHEPELDPWAPMSPGAAIDPLFPWSSWEPLEESTDTDIKKGAAAWQENAL